MKELIINGKNAGGRLDKIIFRYLDKASPGFVYKMIRKKNITLNDKRCEGSDIVKEGDSIKLYLSDETLARFKSGAAFPEKENVSRKQRPEPQEFKNIRIAFENDDIIALDKPAGMLSQKVLPGDISVNDFLLNIIPADDFFRPGISNRLDRNTSGLILAGKNLAAARELNRAVKDRNVSKKYLCIVKGSVSDSARKSARLSKDPEKNLVSVSEEAEDGADIITAYSPVRVFAAYGRTLTLLEVDLITGKSHQIRAHLAYLGHPLAGDAKYGDAELNSALKAGYQLLHAYRIEFNGLQGVLDYLNGTVITSHPPASWNRILGEEGYGNLEFEGTQRLTP